MISDRWMAHAINNPTAGRRITAVARPGSLLKRQHPCQPRDGVREAAGRDVSYLAMVRECPCLRCGDEPCEPAHVRFASAAFGKSSGMQKKPDDRHSVPLCPGCHRLDRDAQHKRNEREFWDSVGINPLIVAERLYAQRSDLVAMRAVVMVAIAERGTQGIADQATPPPSASPPRRAPPPRPPEKPEGGGGTP
jgi:hypothetical protein